MFHLFFSQTGTKIVRIISVKFLRPLRCDRVHPIACLLLSIGLTGCTPAAKPDADPDAQFNLKNAHGMEVRLASYGARITSIKVPDRNGAMADVVLGFDTVEPYRSSLSLIHISEPTRPY